MYKKWSKIIGIITTLFLIFPQIVLAAGGGEVAPIVIVADTRKLTGLMAWFGNLYNESHLWFAVLTVIIIPVTGVILGLLADVVMSHIGIDLKSRELSEH